VTRFRYGLDPLCLLAGGLYAVCRWLIRPHTASVFWHAYSTDYLLIPAALPLWLWVLRKLGLRAGDFFPTWREIGLVFAVWSIAAEATAPHLFRTATGDWFDVLAYAVGAVIAGAWWTLAGRPGFDLLAPHYTWLEKFLAGTRLQRCRTAWFGELGDARHMLIAGVGHGPALVDLLRRHPELRVTCVDASARMLAVARRRVERAGVDWSRVEFVQASLPDWHPPAGRFDVIATHFFLDCFSPAQLPAVIASLGQAATPNARWIVSDFAVPARGPARWRAQAVHALMYAFFRVATRLSARRLTPPDDLLAANGFGRLRHVTYEWGLLQADLWARTPQDFRKSV
jgi:ubiquinone/menaquinone biosynthesis C-methylase UbiE